MTNNILDTVAYYMPTGDTGICFILGFEGGFYKVQDFHSGAILFLLPEWIEGWKALFLFKTNWLINSINQFQPTLPAHIILCV